MMMMTTQYPHRALRNRIGYAISLVVALLVTPHAHLGAQDVPQGAAAQEEVPPPARAAIRHLLGAEATPDKERLTPRFAVPFQPGLRKPLIAVHHTFQVKRFKVELQATSFFDDAGRFIGAQSRTQITDPMRVTPEQSRRLMRGIGRSIAGVAKLPADFELSTVWNVIGRRVALKDIREFSLYAVRYAKDEGSERAALIIKIWGPRNPLGMPDEFSEVHKNRIRFIYYFDDGTWEADNFL